ncbi:hypothetical protein [Rhizobium sp. YTU87027]|uniref:hypothetical protein n=1 Tax=Rhizobium sp. YTU87027 TaxID=3417741 RepID=UPI003D69F414
MKSGPSFHHDRQPGKLSGGAGQAFEAHPVPDRLRRATRRIHRGNCRKIPQVSDMSKSSFEEQIMQGVYALGRQRDQLASEKRKLARQLRYAQHSARPTSLSKQYDFGMVFFAAMGAVSLILFDASSGSEAWLTPALSLFLMLFACGSALRGRKMVSRIRSFHDRFGSW